MTVDTPPFLPEKEKHQEQEEIRGQWERDQIVQKVIASSSSSHSEQTTLQNQNENKLQHQHQHQHQGSFSLTSPSPSPSPSSFSSSPSLSSSSSFSTLYERNLFYLLRPLCNKAILSLVGTSSSFDTSILAFQNLRRALQLCLFTTPVPPFDFDLDSASLGPSFIHHYLTVLQPLISANLPTSSSSLLIINRKLAHYLFFPCFYVFDQLFDARHSFNKTQMFLFLEDLLLDILHILQSIWSQSSPYKEDIHLDLHQLNATWHLSSYVKSLSTVLIVLMCSVTTSTTDMTSGTTVPAFASSFSEEFQLVAINLLRALLFISSAAPITSSVSVSCKDNDVILSKFERAISHPPPPLITQYKFYTPKPPAATTTKLSSALGSLPTDAETIAMNAANADGALKATTNATMGCSGVSEKKDSDSSVVYVTLHSFLCSQSGLSILGPLIQSLIDIFSDYKYGLHIRLTALNTLTVLLLERFGQVDDALLAIVYPKLLSKISYILDLPTTHTSLFVESLPLLFGMMARVLHPTQHPRPVTPPFSSDPSSDAAMEAHLEALRSVFAPASAKPPCSSSASASSTPPTGLYAVHKDRVWFHDTQQKTHLVMQRVLQGLQRRLTDAPRLHVFAVTGMAVFLTHASECVMPTTAAMMYQHCAGMLFASFPEVAETTAQVLRRLPALTRYKSVALTETLGACQHVQSAMDETKVVLLHTLAGCLVDMHRDPTAGAEAHRVLLAHTEQVYLGLRCFLFVNLPSPLLTPTATPRGRRPAVPLVVQAPSPTALAWNYQACHPTSAVYRALQACFAALGRVGGTVFVERVAAVVGTCVGGVQDDVSGMQAMRDVWSHAHELLEDETTAHGMRKFAHMTHRQQVYKQTRYAHIAFLNHLMQHVPMAGLVREYCVLLANTEDALEKSMLLDGLSAMEVPQLPAFLSTSLSSLLAYSLSTYGPLRAATQMCLHRLVQQAKAPNVADLVRTYADALVHAIHIQLSHVHVFKGTPALMLGVLQACEAPDAGSLFRKEVFGFMMQALSMYRCDDAFWFSSIDVWTAFVKVVTKQQQQQQMVVVVKSSDVHTMGDDDADAMDVDPATADAPTDPTDPRSWTATQTSLMYLLTQSRYLVTACPTRPRARLLEFIAYLLATCPIAVRALQPEVYRLVQGMSLTVPFCCTKQMQHAMLKCLDAIVTRAGTYGCDLVRGRYLEPLLAMDVWPGTAVMDGPSVHAVYVRVLTALVHPKWTRAQVRKVYARFLPLFASHDVRALLKAVVRTCGDKAWFQVYLMYGAGCKYLGGTTRSALHKELVLRVGSEEVEDKAGGGVVLSLDGLQRRWEVFFRAQDTKVSEDMLTFLRDVLDIE